MDSAFPGIHTIASMPVVSVFLMACTTAGGMTNSASEGTEEGESGMDGGGSKGVRFPAFCALRRDSAYSSTCGALISNLIRGGNRSFCHH